MCPLMTFFFFVKLIHLTELFSWQWYETEDSMDGGVKRWCRRQGRALAEFLVKY